MTVSNRKMEISTFGDSTAPSERERARSVNTAALLRTNLGSDRHQAL